VTLIPWQTGFWDATIDKLTGRFGFTVMVIVFDVAGFPVAQVKLEVRAQVTVFPFTSPLVVKVGLLVPALTPFTFHW
jgi:hypothetical protein